jgi:predicted transcriptional regulator
VLGHLLDAHPRRLDSVALAGELRDRLERAEVERAIVNLSEAGLIERRGDAVEPAPKVIEFEARVG